MRHKGLLLCGAAAIPFLACAAPDEVAPAIRTAAITAKGDLFTIEGPVQVSTCDADGGETFRKISNLTFEARGQASPTCTNVSDPDCATVVSSLRADVAHHPGVDSAFDDDTYSVMPQQWVNDGTDHAVSYLLRYSGSGVAGPLVQFQSNTRYVYAALPLADWIVTAPTTPGGTVTQPVVSRNLASYRLRLEYQPIDQYDEIVSVLYTVTLDNGTPTSPRRIISRFFYTCPTTTPTAANPYGWNCATVASPSAEDPAGVNRFVDVRAAGGQPQIILAEAPLTPNDSGDNVGLGYKLAINVLYADGVRTEREGIDLPTPTVSSCAQVDQTIVLERPATELNGSIVLRRDPAHLADSPVVTAYAPMVRNVGTGDFYTVNQSNAPVYKPTATPETPTAFRWLGLPAGSYRVEGSHSNTAVRNFLYPHAKLDYPNRAAMTYQANAYASGFRFPMRGSSTPDGVFQLTEGDADNDGVADLPVTLTLAGDMAYLDGDFSLQGCVTQASVTAGFAEILGSAARGDTSLTRGWAAGRFAQGTSGYLIAAVPGDWVESRYALDINTTGPDAYKGMILVAPAQGQTYTLTAGWDNTATAPLRAYATSQLTVTMSVADPANPGTNLLTRNPQLQINGEGDASLGAFWDPATSAPLGKYFSISQRSDNAQKTEHTMRIIGLSSAPDPTNKTVTKVVPSLEVLVGGQWKRSTLQGIAFPTSTSGSGACSDICIDQTVEPPVVYTDDGNPPVVTGGPVSVTTGATTATVTVTVTDAIDIRSVTADGVAMTPNGKGAYTAVVPVSADTTAITIVAMDQCRKTTTTTVAVTFTDGQCAAEVLQQCMADAPGSVFYVDLTNAAGKACQLPCTIADVGAALTCDTTAITCAP